MAYLYETHVQQLDPLLAKALSDLEQRITTMASQVAANPYGVVSTPPNISGLTVVAANGIFDVQIQDNSPVLRGINYFLEYSTTPDFAQPHVVDLGASRSYRANWGNQTLYFRAYSQYVTSSPSATVYFGPSNNPTAVVGGGAAGPAPQPSTGSGTASNTGQQGGSGFGYQPSRGGKPNVL
jgi:hypothetical protein